MDKSESFEIIELGAGDGTKTKELLKELLKQGYKFDYTPIDISDNALTLLKANLLTEMPTLNVVPKQGDYFEVLSSFKESKRKKVILFLGSNIGNLTDDLSAKFLNELNQNINSGDCLLLGVDLIKDVNVVLPAYNDEQGITSRFNLNLLDRINKELDANLNVSKFKHVPEYTKEEGIAKSYLVSTEDQIVKISGVNKFFEFKSGEKIHTEISRKYNDDIVDDILKGTDFTITNKIMDSKAYFADYILKKN